MKINQRKASQGKAAPMSTKMKSDASKSSLRGFPASKGVLNNNRSMNHGNSQNHKNNLSSNVKEDEGDLNRASLSHKL